MPLLSVFSSFCCLFGYFFQVKNLLYHLREAVACCGFLGAVTQTSNEQMIPVKQCLADNVITLATLHKQHQRAGDFCVPESAGNMPSISAAKVAAVST